MSTNRTSKVLVTNGFNNPATITLTHQFSSDPKEVATWENVPSGQTGDEPLVVHYKTGFATGFDYWHVEVKVASGPSAGTWENSGNTECYLTDEDQGIVNTFSVSEAGGFKMNMVSSNCSASLQKTQ